MSTTTRKGAFQPIGSADEWIEYRGSAYRFPVTLTAVEGGYAAASLTVPSIEAGGSTEAESLSNVTVALTDAVRAAKAGTGEHPKSGDVPRGAKWVFVRL